MDFITLAKTFEKLDVTSKRLEMMEILADLFRQSKADEVDKVIYFLQGGIAPSFMGIEIGMGEKFVEEAIARASARTRGEVEKDYKESGDLGLTAAKFIGKKPKSIFGEGELTLSHVYESFHKIAVASGKGTQDVKINALTELLGSASPEEAKYLARIPIGKLRLGAGDATIIDALSARTAGDKSIRDLLERAYNLCCDLGYVARSLYGGIEKIKKFKIKVGNPVKPALAERLSSAEEIIEKLGPCYAEAKYDGFRCQLHKSGDDVEIFSRKIERTTRMFPEVVSSAKKQIAGDVIIEGEALSYNEDTGEFLPFQETIKRKRKHGIERMAAEFPLKLFVFDVLYDGEDLTQTPYRERRKRLEKMIKEGETIKPSEAVFVNTPEELGDFFNGCIERGLEGIVAKDTNAPYVAGARKFAWIKLKRSYKGELGDTIDIVIVGYFKGRGARAAFGIGAFLGAVYDEKTDMFKTVAKVGSGMTEQDMKNLKKTLDGIATGKPERVESLLTPDVWCKPKYVIEVAADEITRSPLHTCGRDGGAGYALRFPRMVSWIREDKGAEDATTVREILEMYKLQKVLKESV
jgi:DNA ligase-1